MICTGFEKSSGILAITIGFLAERSSFCTASGLETNVELQKHAPALLLSTPVLVGQNTLFLYTCACTPVGPP
eukprot:7988923-Heterocapsa_arctica.AAC.1